MVIENMKNIQILRFIAFFEGLSLLILFLICMPLKYMFKVSFAHDLTQVVGLAHGFLFIAYCLLVLLMAFYYKWNFIRIGLALVASVLPFGTFVADSKIFKKEIVN